jgi:serine protease Do
VRLREGNFELLQLDATAYPGNSGGPVFDAASGQVLGVVNMVLVKAGPRKRAQQPHRHHLRGAGGGAARAAR